MTEVHTEAKKEKFLIWKTTFVHETKGAYIWSKAKRIEG